MSIQTQTAEIGLFASCDNPKCKNITHMGYYDRDEPIDATNTHELNTRANHARVETLAYFIDRGWTTIGNHWYCPTCHDYPRQLMQSNQAAFRHEILNPIRPVRFEPRIITKPAHITTPGD